MALWLLQILVNLNSEHVHLQFNVVFSGASSAIWFVITSQGKYLKCCFGFSNNETNNISN